MFHLNNPSQMPKNNTNALNVRPELTLHVDGAQIKEGVVGVAT